jgi:L-lactate dehydrogenase complex protein LldG
VERVEDPSREAILARVRAAVAKQAPHHAEPPGATREIFPPIGDPLERFQKECSTNNTECLVAPLLEGGADGVKQIVAALPAGEIFVQESPLLRRFATGWQQGRGIRWSSEGIPREESQVTITLAESLVAQTGSVFISTECGGRGAHVVAPVHIVFANISQLVPDLDAAFARLAQRGVAERNSMVCLVTGSSRTADIEKILVLGAHGPRRLIVIISLQPE